MGEAYIEAYIGLDSYRHSCMTFYNVKGSREVNPSFVK